MSLQARIADFLGMVWTQVDNGTDSAAELQEHVATLQQLVVAQRRAPARTGSSGAAEDSAQLNRVFSDPATEVGTPAAAGSGQAKPERKRHGSAGKGTRQKQESMRNALRPPNAAVYSAQLLDGSSRCRCRCRLKREKKHSSLRAGGCTCGWLAR